MRRPPGTSTGRDGPTRVGALGFGVLAHVVRLAVVLGALAGAAAAGVSGWYLGLAANVACVAYAALLVSLTCGWSDLGLTLRPRSSWAWPVAGVLLLEVLLWTVPDGLVARPPGVGLWALTLLLVGLNEELTSRGVVLWGMRRAFTPVPAVGLTALLFGLQHLSALLTTGRGVEDVVGNVAASACYGFALAAFQLRFRWLTVLVVLHAGADLTTILSASPHGDLVVGATCVAFLVLGALLLRGPDPLRARNR